MSTAAAADSSRLSPASRRIDLHAGPYAASVSRLGAALTRLTYESRPLVIDTWHAVEHGQIPSPAFSGAVLAPWPNRVRDGRYHFGGRWHQLPVTEVGRGCALHGLLLWQQWEVITRSAESVTLQATVWPQPGYPFTLDITATYELDADGLRVRLNATNVGNDEAPVGLSIHPYLVPGRLDGHMDDWTLSVPMNSVLEVDPDRLLPRSIRDVTGTRFDLRTPRTLAGLRLDHAYADAVSHVATLTGSDDFQVSITWDERCPWLQVCTIDDEVPRWQRAGVALEPMSCPPDAFNSGTDLWLLGPGTQRGSELMISARQGHS